MEIVHFSTGRHFYSVRFRSEGGDVAIKGNTLVLKIILYDILLGYSYCPLCLKFSNQNDKKALNPKKAINPSVNDRAWCLTDRLHTG